MPKISGETPSAYELKLIVKRGHVTGGGLPHDSFVEVKVDGVLIETTQTVAPGVDYNKVVIKKFASVGPTSVENISFSVFKKRWTSEGFKLVGTLTIPLVFFYLHMTPNRRTEKTFDLDKNKNNLTLTGNLLISWELNKCEIVVVEQKRVSHSQSNSLKLSEETIDCLIADGAIDSSEKFDHSIKLN